MKKRRVCVVTGTRAEYGILYPVLKEIEKCKSLELQLIASNMHLSHEFGLTYKQIEKDGFVISEKIENMLSGDSASAVVKSTGLAMVLLSDSFKRLKPDIVLLLGDRYETLAAASAAMLMMIPVAHIHGGEISEGAVDEKIRHAITKMSCLHFASTEQHRQRIIQMGEASDRVFNCGAPGIDNIISMLMMDKEELEANLGWSFGEFSALFTYHPVTLEDDPTQGIDQLLDILDRGSLQVLFTYANSDSGGRVINQKIEEYCAQSPARFKCIKSLGQLRYLSAMKYVDLLIGNTSSGIIEAASFGKPVINIGERQRGRSQSSNVLNCKPCDLKQAIQDASSRAFVQKCSSVENIYGQGNSAKKICEILRVSDLSVVKSFVDINHESND